MTWKSVDWSRLVQFVDECDPGFAGRVRPSAEQVIAELEQSCSDGLPPNYGGFLRTMGEDQGGLDCYANHVLNGSAVLEVLREGTRHKPDEAGIFRIGLLRDEAGGEGSDIYLDLARRDRWDAPLCTRNRFPGEPEDEQDANPISLAGIVHGHAFKKLVVEAAPETLRLTIDCADYETSAEGAAEREWRRLVERLESMEFVPPFDADPSLWCGTRGALGVMCQYSPEDEMVLLDLAGDEQAAISHVAEILRDNFEVV